MALENYVIRIPGKQFIPSYLVYILELKLRNTSYYYIGQTADNHHITVRPAFRRLAGHFEDNHTSTQNTLYRFILREFVEPQGEMKEIHRLSKYQVSKILEESDIEMHVFPLMPFSHQMIIPLEHQEKVKRLREFEKHLIQYFDQKGYQLINRNRYSIKTQMKELFPEQFKLIKAMFPGTKG